MLRDVYMDVVKGARMWIYVLVNSLKINYATYL